MAEPQSLSGHTLALAKELLDDIELHRLGAEALLLKANRLAQLVGSDETRYWLHYEMYGYNNQDEIALKYLDYTGRWIDRKTGTAYWGPLAQQEVSIEARQVRLKNLKNPQDFFEAQRLMGEMSAMSTIRSKVIALLHRFVSEVYYEKAFSGLAESIFEAHKSHVDALLAEKARDVLEKVPAAYDRLAEGSQEAVSQALNTCRRIIDAFADAVFPPQDTPIDIDGNKVELTKSHVQNRINVYIRAHTPSESRRRRLRQILTNLYERVSTGVHSDVTPSEARSLFLEMYLLLGEILTL